jgi:MaoC like domain
VAAVIEELGGMPELGRLFRRAAFRGVVPAGPVLRRQPPPKALPELLVRRVTVDSGHLARYREVCGFRAADALPLTYPHVLAFPLAMELMTRPGFPFPLPGLVHLENRIEQLRPVGASEPVDVRVRAEHLRRHERGQAVDLVTVLTIGTDEVWRERSVYLQVQGRASRGPRSAEPPTGGQTWHVGTDVGPAYARVSGDRNPIHTSRLAARLFGFPRPIAHGMWSLARCLAALDHQTSTVEAFFKLPILLPATVNFTTDAPRFALHDARTGRPHLIGTCQQGTLPMQNTLPFP